MFSNISTLSESQSRRLSLLWLAVDARLVSPLLASSWWRLVGGAGGGTPGLTTE